MRYGTSYMSPEQAKGKPVTPMWTPFLRPGIKVVKEA